MQGKVFAVVSPDIGEDSPDVLSPDVIIPLRTLQLALVEQLFKDQRRQEDGRFDEILKTIP